jgi:hypothetical protein
MGSVELLPPVGESVLAPSSAQIRAAIGSLAARMDTGLHFRESGRLQASLVVSCVEDLGYCVVLEGDDPSAPLVLSSNPSDQTLVEVWLSQNTVRLPKSHFVPSRVAELAALSFAKNPSQFVRHTLVAGVSWTQFNPVDARDSTT